MHSVSQGGLARSILLSSLGAIAGWACSSDAPPELRAHVEGQSIVVALDPGTRIHGLTCDCLFAQEEKYVDGTWVPLQDDRPGTCLGRGDSQGFYLDGRFVPPSPFAGCDSVMCSPMVAGAQIGDAVEFVVTGTQAPPAEYVNVAPATVITLESRPVHGRIRTHVRYFEESNCGHEYEHEVVLEVSVP